MTNGFVKTHKTTLKKINFPVCKSYLNEHDLKKKTNLKFKKKKHTQKQKQTMVP